MERVKAFYFRFSSRDTAQDKFGFERCWQMALDWGVEEENIFWDFDSGANPLRSEYQRLIKKIKTGNISDLGTPNQIRLNRDSVESQQFGRLLRKYKVKLHLLESRGELNLETSEARRQYGLDGLFAEWEYEKCRERYLKNWEDLRRKRISAITPFGYVLGKERKPEIDNTPTVCLLETKEIVSYADILKEIIQLTFKLGSINQVVKTIHKKYGIHRFNFENLKGKTKGRKRHIRQKKLNPHTNNPHIYRKPLFFSPSGLGLLLRNKILIGTLVYLEGTEREEVIPNNHQALITVEEFKQLGKIISGKSNAWNCQTKARYPLSGLVYCGLCGGCCYSSRRGQRESDKRANRSSYYYFRCKNIMHGCVGKPIRSEAAEKAVDRSLVKRYQEIIKLETKPPEKIVNPRVLTLEKQLVSLRKLPIIDENIQLVIKRTQAEIEQISNNEETENESSKEKIKLLESVLKNPLYWETLPEPEKRKIYHSLVNRVIINIDIDIKDKSHPEFKNRLPLVERVDLLV